MNISGPEFGVCKSGVQEKREQETAFRQQKNMDIRLHFGLITFGILLLSLTGCANPGLEMSPRIAATDQPDYRCLAGCDKPVWVDSIPEDANGSHYFVGLSGYHATEQAAREEALVNARREYAAYTGVDVSEIDELVRASFGKASEVVDATVSGRSYGKQQTDANVSRFKAQKYHPVRHAVSRYSKPAGSAFQCYVLAAVPVDEIERVRQWRKEKENAVGASQQERLEQLRQSLQRFDVALANCEALSALAQLSSTWELAGDESSVVRAGIKSGLVRWSQALSIDVGRFSTLCVVGDDAGCPLPVWVWCNGKPVSQLPLRVRDDRGEVVAHTVTAVDGRGEFIVPPSAKGGLRVELDPDAGLLAPLSAVTEDIPVLAVNINLMLVDDFSDCIRAAVMKLFAGPQGVPLSVSSVTLGPVTYQFGPPAGEFALSVKNELRQALTAIPALSIRDPRPRTAEAITQAVTRGIALSGKPNLSAGDSTIQAALDAADAALDIDYRLQGTDVVLALSLVRAYSDEVLRTANVTIPAALLPVGVTPWPSAGASPLSATRGAIHLDIASQLGAGQVYREGEKIRYFLSADRDCHLLLIYQDAAGSLIQIFPNSQTRDSYFRSGSFVEFPRDSDAFEFYVTAPFGPERVYAFAATRPLPVLPGSEQGELRFLNGSLEQIIQTLRDHGRTTGVDYGEAVSTVVTAAR